MPIAKDTCVSQIICFGQPAMLHSYDVIYLAAIEGIIFSNQTIFAKIICACSDKPTKLWAYPLSH